MVLVSRKHKRTDHQSLPQHIVKLMTLQPFLDIGVAIPILYNLNAHAVPGCRWLGAAAQPWHGAGAPSAATRRLCQMHPSLSCWPIAAGWVVVCRFSSYSLQREISGKVVLFCSSVLQKLQSSNDSEKGVQIKQQRQLSSWRSAKCS